MIKQKLLIFFGLLFSLGVEAQNIPTVTIFQDCSKNGISRRIGNGSENGHDYVDLGLSVMWATCNVGATTQEEYGDYFAWGETSPKTNYTYGTYKYGNASTVTKYCTSGSVGLVDNKTILELVDDAAHVNWGGAWRMPTKAEQDELRNNCTWTWTTQNGVNGYQVTGNNGNSIFLPAAGVRIGRDLNSAGVYGYYWYSSLNMYYTSQGYMEFNSRSATTEYHTGRDNGQSVRPVCL